MRLPPYAADKRRYDAAVDMPPHRNTTSRAEQRRERTAATVAITEATGIAREHHEEERHNMANNIMPSRFT